jgi:hypothetical protein
VSRRGWQALAWFASLVEGDGRRARWMRNLHCALSAVSTGSAKGAVSVTVRRHSHDDTTVHGDVQRAGAGGEGEGSRVRQGHCGRTDLFALSLGLDMLDVGGFVTAAIVGG